MINLNDPKDQGPLAFAGVGILLIVGSAIFPFLFPKLNPDTFNRTFRKDQINLSNRKDKAEEDKETFEALISQYRWEEKEDIIAPAALALISKSVDSSKLKLVGFRPQKSTEVNDLIQVPMQFTVDGSFAGVANLVESLNVNKTKLAVQQVQYAAQEGETDQVSATVSILAFAKKPDSKKKATATSKTPTTGTTGVKK